MNGVALAILAAGNSTRAGQPKALRDFRGKPWIERLLEDYALLEVRRFAVAWNPAVRVPARLQRGDVQVLPNPDEALGPLRSAQLALGALLERHADAPCLLLTPIDAPPPSSAVLGALYEPIAHREAAAKPAHQGRGGHPVAMLPETALALLRLDPNAHRLDDALRELGAVRVNVPDPLAIANLNDPDSWMEYVKARNRDQLP